MDVPLNSNTADGKMRRTAIQGICESDIIMLPPLLE
jgi:hypothetical protein